MRGAGMTVFLLIWSVVISAHLLINLLIYQLKHQFIVKENIVFDTVFVLII